MLVPVEFLILLRGIGLGIAIAAPIGPIGMLCIRRTLNNGLAPGIATGMGSAVGDALFGAIAAFGITAALDILLGHMQQLRLIGGLFLLVAAVHAWISHPTTDSDRTTNGGGLPTAIISGFVLTVTNPVTVAAILAVVIGFGGHLNDRGASILTVGIFIGSLAWWIGLCSLVFLMRQRFTDRVIRHINHATAILLAVVGVWAIFSGFGLDLPFLA